MDSTEPGALAADCAQTCPSGPRPAASAVPAVPNASSPKVVAEVGQIVADEDAALSLADAPLPAAVAEVIDKASAPAIRVVLGIQYDGSSWQGWQKQPHGLTVQDKLEEALGRFTLAPVDVVCAGRTDSGVHALEQVVHFDTHAVRDNFSWVRGVNAFLPPSIAVRWAGTVPLAPYIPAARERHGPALIGEREGGFHARFSAISRTYHYLLYNHAVRAPLLAGKAGWTFRPLDVDRMHAAAQALLGEHDFTAFRAVECQARSPVRELQRIDIRREGDMIIFTITANAFLQHMVRNLVGSLIFVGSGRKPVEWIGQLLELRDRSRAAPTFMADGLYLARVGYGAQWDLPRPPEAVWPWW